MILALVSTAVLFTHWYSVKLRVRKNAVNDNKANAVTTVCTFNLFLQELAKRSEKRKDQLL